MIPAPDYSPDPTLTPQQHRIISLLAAGNSITQAAAAESLHRNTIANWRRTIRAFARELEFALREQRQYWHEQATRLAPQAIQAIEDCLTNPNASPSLRFRAATLIMKLLTDPKAKALQTADTLPAELRQWKVNSKAGTKTKKRTNLHNPKNWVRFVRVNPRYPRLNILHKHAQSPGPSVSPHNPVATPSVPATPA